MHRRAARLVTLGMPEHGTVFACEPVTGDLVLTFFACCRAGLSLLYLSPLLTEAEIAPLLDRAAPVWVLTATGEPHPFAPSLPASPLDLPGGATASACAEAARRSASGNADATMSIQTTSGTTQGATKLVQMPHRMVTWRDGARAWWETPEQVYWIHRPLMFAVRGICEMLFTGGTVVLSDAPTAAAMESEMEQYRVTVFWGVPAHVQMLVAQKSPPPAGVRLAIIRTSAAPLSPVLRDGAVARYGARMIEEYASTEGGSMTTAPLSGVPVGSIGRPYPGIHLRIVDMDADDSNTEEVPPDKVGRVLLRSPGMMTGYVGGPDAAGGWLPTGDLASRDRDGFLFLHGREALRINVRGHTIAPEEIEAVLEAHPGVAAAIVTGIPGRYGIVLRAAIVPHGTAPSGRELRVWCRARLAGYKVPRRWSVRKEDFPRSALGKVLRSRV